MAEVGVTNCPTYDEKARNVADFHRRNTGTVCGLTTPDEKFDRHAGMDGDRIAFNKEARDRYLAFATGGEVRWPGGFRDLAAVSRGC